MATNKNENQPVIGETKLIIVDLTDAAGSPINFADLTSSSVKVFDVLGNTLSPTISVGDVATSLQYEVVTETLREGEIKGQHTIVYPDADFASGQATDIAILSLFTLTPPQA